MCEFGCLFFDHLKERWRLTQKVSSLEVIQAATIPGDGAPEDGPLIQGKYKWVNCMTVLGIHITASGSVKTDFDHFEEKVIVFFMKYIVWKNTRDELLRNNGRFLLNRLKI